MKYGNIYRTITVLLCLVSAVAAQVEPEAGAKIDSMRRKCGGYARWIIPASFVTYGITARFNETPMHRFDRHVTREVDKHVNRRYPVDDYLQYAPAALAFGLDFVPGVSSEHNLRDRTLLLATSGMIAGVVVTGMKHSISVWRPDGSADNSFPSGHTAIAFTGAHLLFREYRNQSLWIGIGGYAAATATGALRVVNKRHWVSDVVTGAGVGILSVEAAYLMLPVWHNLLGIDSGGERMTVIPAVTANSVGIGLVYTF